jgi:hypothetical protein
MKEVCQTLCLLFEVSDLRVHALALCSALLFMAGIVESETTITDPTNPEHNLKSNKTSEYETPLLSPCRSNCTVRSEPYSI